MMGTPGVVKGKVAIVTGASRGIGRAIAERLARDGAYVVVNYTSRADAAKKVVTGIEAKGGRAVAIQADVSQLAELRRLFKETIKLFKRLDILVNNAGIFIYKSLGETTEDDFDRLFAINTRGAFFAMQEAAKCMADGGRIINISTGATRLGFPGMAAYVGAKGALEQFTRVVAKELGPRKITVNTVSPGYTETDMLSDPSFKTMGEQASPLKRIGTPKDIAAVVAFLVGPEGGWITGDTIQAGGGVAM